MEGEAGRSEREGDIYMYIYIYTHTYIHTADLGFPRGSDNKESA